MHEDEINTFCCMVNQSQMLCGQIWQECFNIGLQEKSEHISCFQCNSSPPFKLDSKRLTSPGIAHILAQPWRSQIVWSTSYVEPEQSAEITSKICLAKHYSHKWLFISQDNPLQCWVYLTTYTLKLAMSNVYRQRCLSHLILLNNVNRTPGN